MRPGSQKKILIIARPAIGDALLITPLIHSIRDRHPDAIIDVLVSNGQEGILEGNPDIDTVLTIDLRPGIGEMFTLARKLWRKYDIAITNGADDRAYFYLWLFGKKRVAVALKTHGVWKRWIADVTFGNELGTHVLLRNNGLGNLLGYESCYTVFPPRIDRKRSQQTQFYDIIDCSTPFAVLHMDARLPYKRWSIDGWSDVAHYLAADGVKLYLTGGKGEAERQYLRTVMDAMPASTVDLSGKLRFAEVSELIANCEIYVGVDTVNSHVAAAQGVPTVVLFGPEDPFRWGPWPRGFVSTASPWRSTGSQRIDNVMIVQAAAACSTCEKGKCIKLRSRGIDCSLMMNISSRQVIDGISEMLSENTRR